MQDFNFIVDSGLALLIKRKDKHRYMGVMQTNFLKKSMHLKDSQLKKGLYQTTLEANIWC
jgi:hypothetical protein